MVLKNNEVVIMITRKLRKDLKKAKGEKSYNDFISELIYQDLK